MRHIFTKRPYTRILTIAIIGGLIGASNLNCSGKNDPSYSAEEQSEIPKGPVEFQEMTSKAYKLKRNGNNADALKMLKDAEKITEPGSKLHASSLDDQASVLMRMGKFDEAKKLYTKSISILKGKNGNQALLEGVERRLNLLQTMQKKGIKCNEPPVPDPEDKRPYFPNVREYQEMLGTLTREVAKCRDSNSIEAMTTSMTITGDGRLISAFARGEFEGTDVEKCVAQKLEKLVPSLQLPEFRACFRGFTYPFMLGNHPDKKDSVENAEKNANDGIPAENAGQGEMPSIESAKAGAQRLLDAYMKNDFESASTLFFPADAFDIVKDSPNPGRYHKKLIQWYKEDFDLERKRFTDGDWKVTAFTPGNCKWKAPGSEANKVGYWSCTRNTVSVESGEKKRRFEIQVLINWGKNWYITHLRPIRK